MARLPVAGPIVIPNCAQVRVVWSDGSRILHNVFHGTYTSPTVVTPTLPETIFAALKSSVGTTTWLGHIAPAVSLLAIGVKDLGSANKPEYMSTGPAALGTGTGTQLPLNTAMAVTLRTAQSGQAFRGRVYLGGMVDSVLAGATTFTAAAGTDAIGFVNGLLAIMNTQQIPMCVAQRALNAGTHHDGSPWAARPAGTVPVTAVNIANPRVDSQRRRTGR